MDSNFNTDVIKIKVVGVGGAGNNVVSRMTGSTEGIEFINVNTDAAALAASTCDVALQIGEKVTFGRGAGSDPDVGRKAAEESRNNIEALFKDADMVFVTAGMGGGTGTGAAPVVAAAAREAGALTVGVVTRPFKFEGTRKAAVADAGIEELTSCVDTLFVIPNEKLKDVTDQKITFANAFQVADGVLNGAVAGIADLLRSTSFINLDFADLKTVMQGAGRAHMGIGSANGKDKIEEATRDAIFSPLMETSVQGARRVLIKVTGSLDITMEDVERVVGRVEEAADPDANIIFGVDFDDKLVDALKVVAIATDFDAEEDRVESPEEPSLEPLVPAPEPVSEKPDEDEEWNELISIFGRDK
ncbi:MAG: cell division protein FtsZ [Oscillospiraceae bacterium]|nr:cell division protein FtsZ [Oscillospiraceae bacterium]